MGLVFLIIVFLGVIVFLAQEDSQNGSQGSKRAESLDERINRISYEGSILEEIDKKKGIERSMITGNETLRSKFRRLFR